MGFRRQEQGVTAVEFALMLPLLLLILLGAADFSRIYTARIKIDAAARAGVHYGSRVPANVSDHAAMQSVALADAGLPGMTSVATDFCYCNGQPPVVSCSSSCAGPDSTPQTYVQVATAYDFHTLVNYPGIPATVHLSSTARMRAQ